MKKLKVFFTACAIITGVIIMSSFFQMKQMEHWESPKSADLIKNPLKGNIAATLKGKILFKKQCIMCHGSKGKGNGSAAADLKPRPTDLTSEMTQSHSDGALFWKIKEGRKPMPSTKKSLTNIQRWEVLNYVRELQKQSKK